MFASISTGNRGVGPINFILVDLKNNFSERRERGQSAGFLHAQRLRQISGQPLARARIACSAGPKVGLVVQHDV